MAKAIESIYWKVICITQISAWHFDISVTICMQRKVRSCLIYKENEVFHKYIHMLKVTTIIFNGYHTIGGTVYFELFYFTVKYMA